MLSPSRAGLPPLPFRIEDAVSAKDGWNAATNMSEDRSMVAETSREMTNVAWVEDGRRRRLRVLCRRSSVSVSEVVVLLLIIVAVEEHTANT